MTHSLRWENITRRYSRYYVYIEPVVSDPLIRGYFSLVSSLILIVILLISALSPTINTIVALQKKINDERKIVENLKKKIDNLVVAQANYSQVENSLPVLYAAIPDKPSPQTVISGVINCASTSGLILSGLQFKEIPLSKDAMISDPALSKDPANLPVMHFSLSVKGNSQKVRDFLARLENLSRLIRIVNVSTMGSTDSADDSFNIVAVSYFLPEP